MFDLIFVDVDKKSYIFYYELVLKLFRIGGIMVFDNMLWFGDVIDLVISDLVVDDICELNWKLSNDEWIVIFMLLFFDGLMFVLKIL